MIKKREFRAEQIKKKISEALDSVSIVEENIPEDIDQFLESGLIKDGIYKKVEFAIESLVDALNIINSDLRLGSPETEESIINHIEREKILSKDTAEKVREMKKFRNVLIHRYGEIDDKKAFETISEGLKDFEAVIEEIEEFLKKKK